MIIPEGFAQANIVFGGSGAPLGAEVAIGLDVSLAPLDPTEVAQAVWQNWSESILIQQSQDVVLEGVRVKFGPTATGPSGEWSNTNPGGLTSASTPPNVSWLITKTTNLGGRAGSGRMYVPGIAENTIDASGNIGSTLHTAMQTAATSFLDKQAADSLPVVLLHGLGSPLAGGTPVQQLVVQPRAATQRRRLRK